MTQSIPVDINLITKISDDLNDRFSTIPFGNSKFQNENFVINAQFTPARAYRAIGLAMSARVRALKEAYYSYQKELVNIEELEDQLKSDDLTKYDRKRKELELQEKQSNASYLVKLVTDAAFEVETFTLALNKFPRYTREQFELEERSHFDKKLRLQVNGVQGAHESLFNMGVQTKEIAGNVFGQSNYKNVMEQLEMSETPQALLSLQETIKS